MMKEKFIYLFGNRYSRMLSRERVARLFNSDDTEISISDIKRDVREIAFYTREKEKEECRLARLPLITDDTSEESPEFISAEKVQTYTDIIEELQKALIASLPKLISLNKTSDRAKVKQFIFRRHNAAYDAAIRFAIQYRVLEQVKALHCESCQSLIEQYNMDSKTDKVISIQEIQNNLITEYDEKINNAKITAMKKIACFIQETATKPTWQRLSIMQPHDYVAVVVGKEIDSREMVLCVKQISTTRLLPEYDKPYVIEPFSLFVDKLRVKPVGKK